MGKTKQCATFYTLCKNRVDFFLSSFFSNLSSCCCCCCCCCLLHSASVYFRGGLVDVAVFPSCLKGRVFCVRGSLQCYQLRCRHILSRWPVCLLLATHGHTHTHTHTRGNIHIGTWTHTHMCIHTHQHMHTYAHTHICAHTYMRTHTHTQSCRLLNQSSLLISHDHALI